jgi:hypothetical protein
MKHHPTLVGIVLSESAKTASVGEDVKKRKPLHNAENVN